MKISLSFIKKTILPLCLTLFLLFFTVFKTKFYVKSLKEKLQTLEKELVDRNKELNVLKAEFAYLTTPKRIEKLANEHLKDMQNITPEQVIRGANQ